MFWPALLVGVLFAQEVTIPSQAFQPISVSVVRFKDLGSQGVILSEDQFTHLLFEKVDTTRFHLVFVPDTQSVPPHARVVVSGTYRLTSGRVTCQCLLHDQVTRQQHTISLREVSFAEAQQAILDTLNLYSLSVIVTSDPPGGTVTVNGIPVGTTPIEILNLPADTYTIVVQRQNARKETTIVLTRFQHLSLKLKPMPASAPISQTAVANLPGAKVFLDKNMVCEVWIDGKKVGYTTDSPFKVTPGKHVVRCVHPFYGTKEWTIEAKPNQEIHLRYFEE